LSRHPSPRLDQLRALREANFARAEQLRKEAAKAQQGRGPDTAPAREPAPAAPKQTAGKAVAKPAAKKPAAAKAATKKTSKKKDGK
jgi:hypothetical protein